MINDDKEINIPKDSQESMLFLNVEGLYRGKDKWKKINFLREIASVEHPMLIILTEIICKHIGIHHILS